MIIQINKYYLVPNKQDCNDSCLDMRMYVGGGGVSLHVCVRGDLVCLTHTCINPCPLPGLLPIVLGSDTVIP